MGTKALRKMAKLRLLEIHYTRIPKGLDYLPNELRWIDWDECPSNYLPTTFEANVLVGLRLRWSRLRQLWERRTRDPARLKVVNKVTKGEGDPHVEKNLDSILGLINIVDFGMGRKMNYGGLIGTNILQMLCQQCLKQMLLLDFDYIAVGLNNFGREEQ
ncbi:hypothetical protein LguiB_020692 [Lonicera macranthoides]